jgi:hypothetical protein
VNIANPLSKQLKKKMIINKKKRKRKEKRRRVRRFVEGERREYEKKDI